MRFKIIVQNRVLFETGVIAIGFLIGFALLYFNFLSRVSEMDFCEQFHGKKIYPDFMKSVWVMGITYGILIAVLLLAIIQLFFQRISDIDIAVGLPVFVFISWLLLLLFAFINTALFYSELNVFLLWLFVLVIIGTLVTNIIYILKSFSSSEALNRFLIYPNWFCSIGLFSLIPPVWEMVLFLCNIPI